MIRKFFGGLAGILVATLLVASPAFSQSDPLLSWNDGAVKAAITDFVTRTTKTGSADFIPPEERIATFDNDGTLWSEQPVYFQAAFAFNRIRAMAPQRPEWKKQQPYKAVLDSGMKSLAATGQKGLLQIIGARFHNGRSALGCGVIGKT